MRKGIKYKSVIIKWEDACSHGGYYDKLKDGDFGTCMCESAGFLIQKSRKVVKIGREHFEDDALRDIQAIPRGMVREIRYTEGKDAEGSGRKVKKDS